MDTVSLSQLLDSVEAPSYIDHVALHISGAEVAVLESFPFDRWERRCVATSKDGEGVVG